MLSLLLSISPFFRFFLSHGAALSSPRGPKSPLPPTPHPSTPLSLARSTHGRSTTSFYKLPCVAIVARVFGLARTPWPTTHSVRGGSGWWGNRARAFVIGQRLHRRVRTGAARGGPRSTMHVDIRPDTYTPSHYFQFMFLPILKSANFRWPPAGRSSLAGIYICTGCFSAGDAGGNLANVRAKISRSKEYYFSLGY